MCVRAYHDFIYNELFYPINLGPLLQLINK